VTLAASAALTGGYLWVASGEIVWLDVAGLIRWTVLTVHAWIGLAVVPLVAMHVLPRRWRLLRPRVVASPSARRRLSRRSLVVGTGFGVASLSLFGAAALAERLWGGERRFTGSRWLPGGGVPPATTFFGEGVPVVDLATWRLAIHGPAGEPILFTLDQLRALGEETVTAVLDCTSGWAIETSWTGVRLGAVLEAAGLDASASRIEVRSITGWSSAFAIPDARGWILAWSVAGQPLPAANGAPLRLVAPDHRGLEWVKWVSSVAVPE
jgi:DMSO/TMAO reductase YedYZ molybdopterin-dependent catalytic subunit